MPKASIDIYFIYSFKVIPKNLTHKYFDNSVNNNDVISITVVSIFLFKL